VLRGNVCQTCECVCVCVYAHVSFLLIASSVIKKTDTKHSTRIHKSTPSCELKHQQSLGDQTIFSCWMIKFKMTTTQNILATTQNTIATT